MFNPFTTGNYTPSISTCARNIYSRLFRNSKVKASTFLDDPEDMLIGTTYTVIYFRMFESSTTLKCVTRRDRVETHKKDKMLLCITNERSKITKITVVCNDCHTHIYITHTHTNTHTHLQHTHIYNTHKHTYTTDTSVLHLRKLTIRYFLSYCHRK